MTTAPDRVDRYARQAHAAALAHVSPEALARLRDARRGEAGQSAAGWRRPSWLAGGALAAALVLGVALRPEPLPPRQPTQAAVATAEDLAGPLQEDPGFYLWLASADAPALALE